jgi:hypothetical protein
MITTFWSSFENLNFTFSPTLNRSNKARSLAVKGMVIDGHISALPVTQ